MGGQLLRAVIPPHKDRLVPLLRYYERQMLGLGLKVELGKIATEEDIKAAKPDAVIMATGTEPLVPSIPGIERPLVAHAFDILDGKVDAVQRVAIIGGELVGCETAEFLAQKGKQVTVVRRGKQMAQRVNPSIRELLLLRLEELGVRFFLEVDYKEINDRGLVITRKGQEELIEVDTVVLATGAMPRRELPVPEGIPTMVVGDCQEPRGIKEAISEGRAAAMSL